MGGLMCALYVAANVHRTVLSSTELRRFKARQSASVLGPQEMVRASENPDFSLWSEHRVKDYEEILVRHFTTAIAILRIPKINVEVPVLEGTDALSLNRGVGHVMGTAYPNENGNMAIAGHRDSFFRGLKNIALGDAIEMATIAGTKTYIIDRITIVDPGDVSVLKKRSHSSLTLITCYPFHFIGSAPKRYIVQASAAGFDPENSLSPVIPGRNQAAFTKAQTKYEPVSKRQD
jgi:sortase A